LFYSVFTMSGTGFTNREEILAPILGATLQATPANNCTVFKGYLEGDLLIWLNGIGEQEKKYRETRSRDDLFVLILSKYGYIGYIVGMKLEGDVREILSSTEENVELLAKEPAYASTAAALRGAMLAMRIKLNPLKATYLGTKSLRLMEESISIDKNNPVGWVELGNARFHMPSFAGGSYKEAIRCFEEAIDLFENDPLKMRCNWHYLHALAWLAKSYEGVGDNVQAKKIYEKLLKTEPGFQWVSRELYPTILKKTGVV
jgi:tetratricopeptide (TPR) repeat protein